MKARRPRPGSGGAAGTGTEHSDPILRPSTDLPPDQAAAVTLAPRPTLAAAIKPIPRVPLRDKLLWSLDDLAALLGISRRMLERMLASGRLCQPSLRIGRRILFKPEAIHAWLDQQGGGAHGQAR
jgi:excisionase family DNA binding protein